jgi:hypothetical protein
MKKLGFVLAFGLFAAACGGGGGLSLQSYKDDMCKCKDEKCVDAVEKKYEKFKEEQVEKMAKSQKMPTDAENKLSMDAMECEMNAKMGEAK